MTEVSAERTTTFTAPVALSLASWYSHQHVFRRSAFGKDTCILAWDSGLHGWICTMLNLHESLAYFFLRGTGFILKLTRLPIAIRI